jgi:A/G-specific adenine glycosylase
LVFVGVGKAAGKGEWWPVERVEDAGLPTVFLKAARLAPRNRRCD